MKRVVSSSIGRNLFIRNTQPQHRFHSVLQASLPCQESVCIDNTMEEKSTKDLLHYSSIGIDEVFLNDISKMELVGDLKKRAQDFVVNEIGPSGLVASLALPECERAAPSSSLQSEQAAEDEVPDNPLEHCRQLILEKADEGSKRFPEIEALSARARSLLRNSTAETTAPTSSSDVPSTADSLCLTFDKPDKEERGVLFRALAYAFPLLNASRGETSAQIVLTVNETFHKLIPVLEHPETDLLRLYEYVAYGYVNTQRFMERNVIRNETPKLRLRDSIEREDRRAIHRLIAEETCGLLGTETIKEANDKVSLSIQWTKSAKRKLSRKRGGGNQQLLCVVEKTSIENLRMINLLSKYIHVRRGDIGIAGIKDMKAVTTQFLTIGHVAGVGRAQKSLERNGIKIKPVRFVAQPLKRGMLRGNRFEIMLRNVRVVQKGDCFLPANENHVNEAIRRLNKGFVNFFGMQRVGNPGTREMIGYTSRDIGRAILQQNHEEAIDFLLQGRKNVDRVDKFRETWKSTKDATLTIRDLPSNTDMWPRERAVLQGLKRYGDPCAAFKCLQYWDRVYYQNAYQSYVWNVMASERLRHGPNVLVGDLIIGRDGSPMVVGEKDLPTVCLEQVVLPLPGGKTTVYPENMRLVYKDFLKRDGIALENLPDEVNKSKACYRTLVAPVNIISFDVLRTQESSSTDLKLVFELDKGCFATMLMRELQRTTKARDWFHRRAIHNTSTELEGKGGGGIE